MFKYLLPLLFSSQVVFAAVASTTVWEFRDTATGGAMVNGGGFNPSNAGGNATDYSQQNGSQFNGSDLATSNGTTNPCTVTSASHNFVSTDVGNFIRIASGGTFTATWYEIVSVAANAATLDKACASGASTSAGVWREGGALVSGAADNTWSGVVSCGNMIWFKNGTYSPAAAMTIGACTSTTATTTAGYNSSRGDNPTGTSRPTISTAAVQFSAGNFNTLKNIIFTGTAASVVNSGQVSQLYNLKVTNTSTTAGRNAITSSVESFIANSEIVSYRGPAVSGTSGGVILIGNYIHDSDIGVTNSSTTAGIEIVNNIFDGMVTAAIQITAALVGPSLISGNTIYGFEDKVGIGLSLATATRSFRLINNIFYGLATGVSSVDAFTGGYFDAYNDYFNNTADVTNWTKGIGAVASNPAFKTVAEVTGTAGVISGSTLTDSLADFTNVVNNQDFVYIVSATGATAGKYLITSHTTTALTLNSAPGGSGTNAVYKVTTGHNFAIGLALKFKGFPGAFPATLTTSYVDVGAAQRHEYGRPVKH